MKYPDDYLNKFICGDVLETMESIPDGSVDLVVTSPPYNLGSKKPKPFTDTSNWKSFYHKLQRVGYDVHDDNMPKELYIEWQRKILKESLRVTSDRGAIFYNQRWQIKDGDLDTRQEILQGFPLRQIIIWKKVGGTNFSKRFFLPNYEVIYLFAKPKFELNDKSNQLTDVWEVMQEKKSWHEAPFPIEIPLRCISSVKNVNVVLDPFMGSGTTAKACKQLNKQFIGIDISQNYCDKAKIDYDNF